MHLLTNARHACFLKTYECKWKRYMRISQGIICIALFRGIMRKMRQSPQYSCYVGYKAVKSPVEACHKIKELGNPTLQLGITPSSSEHKCITSLDLQVYSICFQNSEIWTAESNSEENLGGSSISN